MNYKRITLLAGHYGSGKTNIAVNMALELKKAHENTAIADLDIVNPYFRTLDSKNELEAAGIRLIVSPYANSSLDIPALPQDMYAIVDDESMYSIIDVGGDDRGALALGRLSRMISDENNYDMFLVINKYRPLTPDAASVKEVLDEIEEAGRLKFTGIINNSNLGAETDAQCILDSVQFADEVSELTGLPVVLTSVEEKFMAELSGKIGNLFPMKLQKRPVD
ncbi:MAG: ParA family protein [Erysipelotrichaceae bacterium]|nr:ParA family protein [Erysipelotrichaceae bacterium]